MKLETARTEGFCFHATRSAYWLVYLHIAPWHVTRENSYASIWRLYVYMFSYLYGWYIFRFYRILFKIIVLWCVCMLAGQKRPDPRGRGVQWQHRSFSHFLRGSGGCQSRWIFSVSNYVVMSVFFLKNSPWFRKPFLLSNFVCPSSKRAPWKSSCCLPRSYSKQFFQALPLSRLCQMHSPHFHLEPSLHLFWNFLPFLKCFL